MAQEHASDTSLSKTVTAEAFIHHCNPDIFDALEFLKDYGADLLVSSDGTAHLRFDGRLALDEANLLLSWAKTAPQNAGAGRIVVLIGRSEPNAFEWHDLDQGNQSWQQGFNEFVSLFGTKFTHLVKAR